MTERPPHPMFVRPDVQAYFAAAATGDASAGATFDPAALREAARQAIPRIELPAREMRSDDIAIPSRSGGQICARLYHPAELDDAATVIVYYHGGGWVMCDLDTHDSLCREIAVQMKMTVLSVGYRLAPEHPFPAAIEDAVDAARWAARGQDAIGRPVTGLILAGDSAGGTLALVVAREISGGVAVPIRAQLLIYPVSDLSRVYPSQTELAAIFGIADDAMEKFYQLYLGEDDFAAARRHVQVSPLLADDWADFPPCVVVTCSIDMLRDQGRALAAKLTDNGIDTIFLEARGQIHGSFTMRKALPSAQIDLSNSLDALKSILKRNPAA